MKKSLFLTSIILLGTLQGCSTIVNGTSQSVKIQNLPQEGCLVHELYMTPLWNTGVAQKGSKSLEVKCNKETRLIKPSVSKEGVFSAVVLDGGIVDSISGAMWQYPSTVDYDNLEIKK
jgi:hypothetical protein